MPIKSSCCKANLLVVSGDEGTSFHKCDKCDKPCNIHQCPVELWWNDPKYHQIVAGCEFSDRYDMPAIITEAERRIRDEMTKETAMSIVESMRKSKCSKETFKSLIAEASRRAKLEAWEEAKELLHTCLNHTADDPFELFNSRIQQYGKEE